MQIEIMLIILFVEILLLIFSDEAMCAIEVLSEPLLLEEAQSQ